MFPHSPPTRAFCSTPKLRPAANMLIEHGRSIRLIHHVDHFSEYFYGNGCHSSNSVVRTSTTSTTLDAKSTTSAPLIDKDPQKEKLAGNSLTTRSTRPERRVQFDLTLNQTHPVDPLLEEEQKERWFSSKELQSFRRDTIIQRGRTSSLLPTLSSSSPSATFQAVVKGIYEDQIRRNSQEQSSSWTDLRNTPSTGAATSASSEWEQAYFELVSQHPELAGMERYALEAALALGSTKKRSKQCRRQQLALMHELQYRNGGAVLRFNAESNTEFIRHSCETVSLPSRQFAHKMATLRAVSLQWEQDDTDTTTMAG